METIRLMPQFAISMTGCTNAALAALKEQVKDSDLFSGQFREQHAILSFTPAHRHFWSPWLNLDMQDEEGYQTLHGRFSPHPSIWTGFMFAYLTLLVGAFFSIVLAASQVVLDVTPWGLIGIPICVLTALLLWITSQIGQRLASEQMLQMRGFVESSIES